MGSTGIMSGTRRTPIARPLRGRFSDEMLDLFLAMQRRQEACRCGPRACFGCEEWCELHGRLANLWPGVRPWFWPIVEHPDARYRAGTVEQELCTEAQARWREIEAASAGRERERAAAEPTSAT
jgi:hypothetical protein